MDKECTKDKYYDINKINDNNYANFYNNNLKCNQNLISD